jgi:hypothetical protein
MNKESTELLRIAKEMVSNVTDVRIVSERNLVQLVVYLNFRGGTYYQFNELLQDAEEKIRDKGEKVEKYLSMKKIKIYKEEMLLATRDGILKKNYVLKSNLKDEDVLELKRI